jgi:hypothetical protein
MQGLPHAACRLQRASPCSQGCCGSLPPHAPCRLQPLCRETQQSAIVFASTRSVQIATALHLPLELHRHLCLHTLRADCNCERTLVCHFCILCLHTLRADCNEISPVSSHPPQPFASTRSVQIATRRGSWMSDRQTLCLHTLRADCNERDTLKQQLADAFASTRSVQIATLLTEYNAATGLLCLHTLRADCNGRNAQNAICTF